MKDFHQPARLHIAAFFQHMPPYAGAVALRGKSILEGIARLLPAATITAFSTTPLAQSVRGVRIINVGVRETENVLTLTQRLAGELHMGYAAARQMCSTGPRPDLLIISSPAYIAALIQVFFARLRRIPYVLDVRDVYPQVYVAADLLKQHSLSYKFFRTLSRWMYCGASLVICATRGLAREVQQDASSVRVAHVYNGFPACLAIRKIKKLGRFTVCFHGILGFFQDVENLIKIANLLYPHEIDMLVIGYGRKEKLLRAANLPNLKFLGRQSFERTISEIERCHLGLCLRLNDGISKDAFPVKVWEYLGLGIPAIVTPPCEAGEFLRKHQCGIVHKSGDIAAIVETILTLKKAPALRQKLSDNCRKIATEYTREKTGLAAAQLIMEVAIGLEK